MPSTEPAFAVDEHEARFAEITAVKGLGEGIFAQRQYRTVDVPENSIGTGFALEHSQARWLFRAASQTPREGRMSHDTDRTQSMFEVEAGEPEFEAEGENEPSPFSGEEEAPFDEMTEMELASEALEITDEEQLEQFLGNLFKNVTRGAQKFAESAAGQNLMRILKPVANQALPIAGATIGGVFGGPAGTMLGRQLGSQASQWFEIEPEGMSDEDAQFETASIHICRAAFG